MKEFERALICHSGREIYLIGFNGRVNRKRLNAALITLVKEVNPTWIPMQGVDYTLSGHIEERVSIKVYGDNVDIRSAGWSSIMECIYHFHQSEM